jgi:hypothetical protein
MGAEKKVISLKEEGCPVSRKLRKAVDRFEF